MIKYNPLYKSNGQMNGALTTPPSESIVFDVPGKCIWVKGVKLKGTDTTYTFSHDNYITLTNTPGDPEDIKIGVDINTLKAVIDTTYEAGTLAMLTTGTNTVNRVWSAKILSDYVAGVLPTTKNIKINGTDYALYTTENSLPTFFAPTTLGTVGQVLASNGSTLTWIDQSLNTDYQVTLGVTTSDNDYRILLKLTANDTAETTFVNFASTLTYNPSTKNLKVNGLTVVHTGNINSANATIGTSLTTIAILSGVEIKAKIDVPSPSYWDIDVDKAGFDITSAWIDSEINLQTLSQGPCLLYINYCGVHYTGTFAYAGTNINTDDEFPLHESGYTLLGRGRIFAKIAAVSGTAKLLLSALVPETNIPLFTIKIKQIAIL